MARIVYPFLLDVPLHDQLRRETHVVDPPARTPVRACALAEPERMQRLREALLVRVGAQEERGEAGAPRACHAEAVAVVVRTGRPSERGREERGERRVGRVHVPLGASGHRLEGAAERLERWLQGLQPALQA